MTSIQETIQDYMDLGCTIHEAARLAREELTLRQQVKGRLRVEYAKKRERGEEEKPIVFK